MILILLVAVLFTVIYQHYNAFAESSDNDETQCDDTQNGENNDENCVSNNNNDNDNNGADTECKNGRDDNGNCKDDDSNTGENNGADTECKNGRDNDGNCVSSSDKLATVLHLDDISEVKSGQAINIDGTLKTKSDGTGIEGREITLEGKGIENLDVDKSVKTEDGGMFTFTTHGNAPVEGNSLKFKASFDGDDEYSESSDTKEATYQSREGIPTSIVDLKVTPGDQVVIEGTLKTTSDHTAIDGRDIALEGKPIDNLDIGPYNTKDGGKFTFTIPGSVQVDENSGLLVHFKGDGQYSETSEPVTIPREGIPTSIVDLKVTPGDQVVIEGTLKTTSDHTAIDGRDIALEGKPIDNLDIGPYNTKDGGKFTFSIPGIVLSESTSDIPKPPIGRDTTTTPVNEPVDENSGLLVHFKGDGQYSETSEPVTIPREGIPTSIVDLKVTPGDQVVIEGTLKTTSDHTAIDGRDIALEGKPIDNLDIGPYNTKDGGKFTFSIPGIVLSESTSDIPKPPIGRDTTTTPVNEPVDENSGLLVHFKGDGQYSETSQAVPTPAQEDIPPEVLRVQVRDVVLNDTANKKGVEIKLPTPGDTIPSANNSEPCKFHHFVKPIHGDNLNEIESKGSELIYKAKESISKTFEYSMIYDCPAPTPPPEPDPITDPLPQDTTPPGAPEIESPSPGTQKIGISQISGTAEAGSIVTVFNGENTKYTTTADRNFHWSLTLTPSLEEGTYSFKATATDQAGNTGNPSSDVNVKVDRTGPTIIAIPPGKNYKHSPMVTLSSNDPDYEKQAIYYTTNGDIPTPATRKHYTGPVDTVPIPGIINCQTGATKTITFKFMGYDKLGNEGNVGTAIYTIGIVC